ncbi:MAG: hypothetical protein H0Z34_06260 [Brevibacillus sp.]|nr:hypothetical protein [Brevibacillus sp.]
MSKSPILQANMADVNRLLIKVSAVGITVLYGLSFFLVYNGLQELSWMRFWLAAGSSYAIFGLTLLLYRIPRLRQFFHYIFPLEMFFTVGIGVYLFESPSSVHFIWLIPLIYAGLYAERGPMLLLSVLVMAASIGEALLVRPGGWQQHLGDVLEASIVMLIVVMRLISLVNRSRAIIEQTEQQANHNRKLREQNEQLLNQVAATAAEIGEVVRRVTEMSEGTRTAMNQIATASEQIVTGSHDSQSVLRQNRQLSAALAEEAERIKEAAHQAVNFAGHVQEQAQEGENVVEQIAQVVARIDRQSLDTSHLTEQLHERTGEITEISSEIGSIAKNVSVVAINASIEAARAGAAGRTFQVVAEQVQGLARQTELAAEAIGQLAERVRSDLEQIRLNMQKSREVVRQGVQISQEAQAKLDAIGRAVDEIHRLLQDMAAIATDQQEASASLNSGLETLQGRTEQSLTQMDEAASATEETAAIMEEMAAIVHRLHERVDTLEELFEKKEDGNDRTS